MLPPGPSKQVHKNSKMEPFSPAPPSVRPSPQETDTTKKEIKKANSKTSSRCVYVTIAGLINSHRIQTQQYWRHHHHPRNLPSIKTIIIPQDILPKQTPPSTPTRRPSSSAAPSAASSSFPCRSRLAAPPQTSRAWPRPSSRYSHCSDDASRPRGPRRP